MPIMLKARIFRKADIISIIVHLSIGSLISAKMLNSCLVTECSTIVPEKIVPKKLKDLYYSIASIIFSFFASPSRSAKLDLLKRSRY